MLPPSPSGVSRGMVMMSPQCVCVCVYLAHTQTKHYLHYFPLLPFFRQRGIVSKPKITTSAALQIHPASFSLNPQQWRRNPSFGRGERGISCLSSSQRGHKCRESFTNWCLTMIGRKKRGLLLCVRPWVSVLHRFLCIFVLFIAVISC